MASSAQPLLPAPRLNQHPPDATNMPTSHQTFHPFPRLPIEIRQMIWKMSAEEPREVIIPTHGIKLKQGRFTHPPAVLHACFESRAYLKATVFSKAHYFVNYCHCDYRMASGFAETSLDGSIDYVITISDAPQSASMWEKTELPAELEDPISRYKADIIVFLPGDRKEDKIPTRHAWVNYSIDTIYTSDLGVWGLYDLKSFRNLIIEQQGGERKSTGRYLSPDLKTIETVTHLRSQNHEPRCHYSWCLCPCDWGVFTLRLEMDLDEKKSMSHDYDDLCLEKYWLPEEAEDEYTRPCFVQVHNNVEWNGADNTLPRNLVIDEEDLTDTLREYVKIEGDFRARFHLDKRRV
ncbi:hypothetical protein F5Y16DRAFT_401454 [Xylariaceae sp. FL0255]|nr:hypothetical protein F5Y16DRAFT_401454 [Xylariaceae sp. FL0255]